MWSAVDGRIAFLGLSEGTVTSRGLQVMNGDGSGLVTLLESEPHARVIPYDWSQDGGLLLFTKETGPGRTDIFLLRVANGTVVRLTADAARKTTPTFW